MVAQQPRNRLRDASAPNTSTSKRSGYRHPVVPAQSEFVPAKPLPPPPSPFPGETVTDTERSEDGESSPESEPRTAKEDLHSTGTPPGSTSLIVAGKVYHVLDNPNNPDIRSQIQVEAGIRRSAIAHDDGSQMLEGDEHPPEAAQHIRKKSRTKGKGKSLAAPPTISSPVPFPHGDALDSGNPLNGQSFEIQQQAAFHPHPDARPIVPSDPENAFFEDRSRSPSPQRDLKSGFLRRFRSRKSSARQQPPLPLFIDADPENAVAQSDSELHRTWTGTDEENMRGRPRKPSFTEGLTRSLSGAYRSVRSGMGRRLSLRRSESVSGRHSTTLPGPERHDNREDAVDAIVERMRRNCTRAQSNFTSGNGDTGGDGLQNRITPDDLPPQWHVALKRDLDQLLLHFAGGDPEQVTDRITQARALAHFADLSATIPLARECFTQLNAVHPLDSVLRHFSSLNHRRNRSDGEAEQSGTSAADFADMKRGRLSTLHAGRRHWTTVEALVKRCKACMESETEVSRMCRILDGTLPIPPVESDSGLKIRIMSPDDALVGVLGYLRSATYAYPTTLQLRDALEKKFPRQICVGESSWAILFSALCEAISLFRADPDISPPPAIRGNAHTEDAETNGHEHPETEDDAGEPDGAQDPRANDRDEDRDKIFVDSLHLRAVDNLLCVALEAPTTLSAMYILQMNGGHKSERSRKKEIGPSPYVKMVRLLVRDDIRVLYPLASNKADEFVKARLDYNDAQQHDDFRDERKEIP